MRRCWRWPGRSRSSGTRVNERRRAGGPPGPQVSAGDRRTVSDLGHGPRARGEQCGLKNHDPGATDAHDTFVAQLAQRARDDLAHRAHEIRELLLADVRDEIATVRLLLARADLEEVPRDPLRNAR